MQPQILEAVAGRRAVLAQRPENEALERGDRATIEHVALGRRRPLHDRDVTSKYDSPDRLLHVLRVHRLSPRGDGRHDPPAAHLHHLDVGTRGGHQKSRAVRDCLRGALQLAAQPLLTPPRSRGSRETDRDRARDRPGRRRRCVGWRRGLWTGLLLASIGSVRSLVKMSTCHCGFQIAESSDVSAGGGGSSAGASGFFVGAGAASACGSPFPGAGSLFAGASSSS